MSEWSEVCTPTAFDYTREYILASACLMVTSLFIGCLVAAHVGSRNRLVTVLAVVTDAILLSMTIWGIILYFTRNHDCVELYKDRQAIVYYTFNISLVAWFVNCATVLILINCWGRCRRSPSLGFG